MDTLGNLKRLVDKSRQSRRWETTAFPTSGGGTLHVPRQRSRGIPTTGGGEGLSIGTPPIGEILHVHVQGHLGGGGEPVLFDTVTYRNGFNKAVTPSSQLELPHGAVYGIEGDLRWTDGYTGGGTVTLLLDDEVLMTVPGYTAAWTRFCIEEEFDAVQGQRLSIVVDHSDGADHEIKGELVIATKEPLKEIVQSRAEAADWIMGYQEGANLSLTLPSGPPDTGDVLLVIAFTRNQHLYGPSGWTQVELVDLTGGGEQRGAWWTVVGTGQSATVVVESALGFSADRGIEALLVRLASVGTPHEDYAATYIRTGSGLTAPSVNGSSGGVLVCFWGSHFDSDLVVNDVAPGMTEMGILNITGPPNMEGASAFELLGASGATGTRTADTTNATDYLDSISIMFPLGS